MTIALWKQIATSSHRFNRRSIEMATSPAIIAFTSLQGKAYTIKAQITEIEATKKWCYAACLKCNQSVLPSKTLWFCTRDGMLEKANTMYRIITTVTDHTGGIQAVIFDRAGRQLLGMTCEELAAKEDPIETLHSIIGKEVYMEIELQHDKKTHALKCVVNKVSFPAANNTEQTSSSLSLTGTIQTPHPTTPAQKANSGTAAKRQLEFHGKLT
ncbi:putative nucleic acid-binding, replication factor A [Helianthus anomalus]